MPPLTDTKRPPLFLHTCARIACLVFFTAICSPVFSQQQLEEKLIHRLNVSASDSERIFRLGHLSQYYYANKDFGKGDSVIERQIMLAEGTMSQSLTLFAYFGNIGYQSPNVATRDRSKNTEVYIRRALEYAKANDLPDYMAMAYANLAAINCTDGKLDEAFKNANLGFTTALNTENDSAKVVCAIELGNTYQQRADILMAFKTYTTAQNIANEKNKETLLPAVYIAIAKLYKKLDQKETAKKYVQRSLAINREKDHIPGRINDFIFLAQLGNYQAGKTYLQEAISLADSIDNLNLKIEAERILFLFSLLEETPAYMMAYLEGKPELKNVFINTGPDYINWMYAEIYLYGGLPDSALLYFKKAENSFNTGYDLKEKKGFFEEYAACYRALKNNAKSIEYYKKSFEIAREASNLRALKSTSGILKSLFHEQGNFEQAFSYGEMYDHYKDSLELLGRERDLALLEIDNVTRQQQREAELAAEKVRRKYNLQYMLITIVVAAAFVLLIMIGMFRVSAFTIRLMGFLSLIFFFEFVILILDHWIHKLTHGEPWKVWLIKIGIISILLPVHHFMEHKLIRYLLSRHLITVRSRLSVSLLFQRKKKLLAKQVELEEALIKEEQENIG